jgi:hypothetical protein
VAGERPGSQAAGGETGAGRRRERHSKGNKDDKGDKDEKDDKDDKGDKDDKDDKDDHRVMGVTFFAQNDEHALQTAASGDHDPEVPVNMRYHDVRARLAANGLWHAPC